MKLLTIDTGREGEPGALLASGEILHLRRAALPGTTERWLPPTIAALLEAGDDGLQIARAIVDRVENADEADLAVLRTRHAITDTNTPLLAPIPTPRLIVAAGLAYRSHLAEMSGTPTPPHPTAFMKSPHSVTGGERPIRLPADAREQVDYEGELAVVFGSECHRVKAEDALEHVAGYTVANDISARDWVRDVWGATTPWDARRTWEVNIMGKQFPGFTALGPVLLTRDEVPDVSRLRLTTRLNGRVMQSAEVSDQIFDLAQTIAWFSRWYHFAPGDVLLTGTPAGVGVGRKPAVFMRVGDVVEVEIDGIGVLRNAIAAP